MSTTIQTKYGTATIGNHGYFIITSKDEGNYNKLLHRLIYEDAHNVELPEDIIVHHKDENKLNNTLENLETVTRAEHIRMHRPCDYVDFKKLGEQRKGIKFSKEWCDNISKGKKGTEYSKEGRHNMSKCRNTSGFYCVSTKPARTLQGFHGYTNTGNKENNMQFILLTC